MNADDLAKILDELGQRLGPTGERVFGLAVRQVVIDGVILAISGVIAVGLTVVMLRWISRYAAADKAKEAASSYHTTSYEIAYAIGGIGFLILMGYALYAFQAAISNLLNPEYAAIRDLLGRLR